MKIKRFTAVILILSAFLCLFSCGNNTFDTFVEELEAENTWLSHTVYTSEQTEQIQSDIVKAGIEIKGEVKSVAHFIKASYPKNTFVYVYEFELTEDAVLFKKAYADSFGNAKIKDNVVVYGTESDAIDKLNA